MTSRSRLGAGGHRVALAYFALPPKAARFRRRIRVAASWGGFRGVCSEVSNGL